MINKTPHHLPESAFCVLKLRCLPFVIRGVIFLPADNILAGHDILHVHCPYLLKILQLDHPSDVNPSSEPVIFVSFGVALHNVELPQIAQSGDKLC